MEWCWRLVGSARGGARDELYRIQTASEAGTRTGAVNEGSERDNDFLHVLQSTQLFPNRSGLPRILEKGQIGSVRAGAPNDPDGRASYIVHKRSVTVSRVAT